MINFLQSPITKAIFSFLSKNWKEVLLVLLFIGFVGKNHLDYRRLEDAYETSQQSLKTQIDNLKSSHEEELRLRDEAVQRYKDELTELQEEYMKNQEKVDSDRATEREEIVREIIIRDQFSKNKDELAEKVELTFGFEYVP